MALGIVSPHTGCRQRELFPVDLTGFLTHLTTGTPCHPGVPYIGLDPAGCPRRAGYTGHTAIYQPA